MIWGEGYHEKEARLREWHLWFAWFPVRLECGRLAWFEYVYCKAFSFKMMDGALVPSRWLFISRGDYDG